MKEHILGLLPDDFLSYLHSKNVKDFRQKQLFNWLYNKQELDFDMMTSLSEDFREELDKDYDNSLPKIVDIATASDETTKYLLELKDHNYIEMVIIPHKGKNTLCVSSQVGCARNCQFCATGKLGFIRNLEVHEIVSQIFLAIKELREHKLTNIVFMGMGEPLDNYNNVLKAIEILQSDQCFNFSPRRITISTAGVNPMINKLADLDLKFKLAVSLNSAIQSKREILMPISKEFPLKELKHSLLDFRKQTSYRITFEYVMIKNFNMAKEDVTALLKFLGDISCKLNLIKWNIVDGLPYETPSQKEIEEFFKKVNKLDYNVTYRKSRGSDISAACGQLACNSKQK